MESAAQRSIAGAVAARQNTAKAKTGNRTFIVAINQQSVSRQVADSETFFCPAYVRFQDSVVPEFFTTIGVSTAEVDFCLIKPEKNGQKKPKNKQNQCFREKP
jgi:hypothetical protein